MSEKIQKSPYWLIVLSMVLIAGGCVAPGRNTPFGTIEDQTAYAPQYRGYRGPETTVTPPPGRSTRVDKPAVTVPDLGSPEVIEVEPEPNDNVIIPEVEAEIPPYEILPEEETGPLFAPPPLTAPRVTDDDEETGTTPARLLSDIVRPEHATQGGDVRFEVTIRNQTDIPVDDVEVFCTFEDGLQFPGKVEKELRRNIGGVDAGDAQTMSLTLIARELGRHCAQFTVKSAGQEIVWKSVCIDVTKQSLSLDVIGPDRRSVGSRAEYTLTITNISDRVLKGMQSTLTFDDALIPKEATEGAEEGTDTLSWNLGDLQPGEVLQLQVEFECGRAADVAKFDVELATTGGDSLRKETGLEIVPPRGVLDLKLRDEGEPAAVDAEITYVVTVHNRGFQDVRNVDIALTPPTGLKLLGVEATQDGEPIQLPHKVQQGGWDFETIPRFAADSTLELRVRAQGVRAGHHKIEASVKSDLDTQPHAVEEWTTINAKR